jgi:sulfite exporter TauE/SafE
MNEPLSFLSAWLLGFLGSVHCMGMCGGIVGALSLNTSGKNIPIHLSYHLGRITTYAFLGFLAGLVGLWLASTHSYVGQVLRILSGVMLILMGGYVLGSTHLLLWFEKKGGRLWQKVQPLSKNLLPVKSAKQGVLLGLLWGLLPCGLIYSTLSWAMVAANPWHSAGLMAMFGLGNLPALLSFSAFAQQLNRLKQTLWVRRLLATLIIAFGGWTIIATMV